MKIKIRNRTALPNTKLNGLRQRILKVKGKFDHLLYAEVFVSEEGSSVKCYRAVFRLGVPGNDIIITNISDRINLLFRKSIQDINRYLNRYKELTTENR